MASRLLTLPTSSAASERTFNALSVVLCRTRNRTLDDKVDKQWRIIVNKKQLRRGDIIGEYMRSSVEQLLIRFVAGGDVAEFGGALGGLVVQGAPGEAPGAPPLPPFPPRAKGWATPRPQRPRKEPHLPFLPRGDAREHRDALSCGIAWRGGATTAWRMLWRPLWPP